MSYWILVFNQQPIDEVTPEQVIPAITRSNFTTLCRQYGLDPVMIEPAKENLAVTLAPRETELFFLLRYRPENEPPIAVYRWEAAGRAGKELLSLAVEAALPDPVQGLLHTTKQIIGVELSPAQLQEMGLLLGYELARWAAEKGKGIVQGLDGVWYHLNRHLAYLPIDTPGS